MVKAEQAFDAGAVQQPFAELRELIETIPTMAFATGPDGYTEFVSRRWQDYSGLSLEATTGGGWQAAIHPDDVDLHVKKWRASLATGEPFESEARHRGAAGDYRWFLVRAVPLRDEHGQIVKWYGTLTDIEDHKRDEALRAGEKRLLEMVATGVSLKEILNALCLIIEEQRNGTLASVLLLNPDEIHLDIAAGPALPDEWKRQMEKMPIGPCAGSCGTAAYRRSAVIVSDIASDPLWEVPEHRACALKHGLRASWSKPVLSSEGKVLGTFCLYYRETRSPSPQDLELIDLATHLVRVAIERDRAQEALRRSEAYLGEAERLTHSGTWALNPVTGKRYYWSEELFRIFGLDPRKGEPSDEAFWEFIHPEDRDRVFASRQNALKQKIDYVVDYRIVLADGTVKHLHTIGHPVVDPAGEIVEYLGTAVDITERKLAEQEREQLHQLEADLAHINRVSMMGELAASLAHDIKQPLTAAVMSATACERHLRHGSPDLDQAAQAASRMINNVMRAAEIMDRVRSLYTRGSPRREPVDLNEIIDEMIGLLQHNAKRKSISIRIDVDPDLPMVTADRVQLQQVLMNLMLNGIEAMKDRGGSLTLASKSTLDGQVLVSVSDTGVGLPEQKSERLFEAFFTTKPQGTGMGLSISRRIIESHGGRLWATNNPGRGATFQFSLPVEAMKTHSPPLMALEGAS
jgi:PAS domain S-box-containing protein